MRIRSQPAVAFAVLLIVAAYLGLAPIKLPGYKQSDKVLHFLTFFLLTTCFYWILETNRRRTLQLTLFVCTASLGIGSEIIQGLLPNGREFDPFDILSNVGGSLAAVALSTWYHNRMLERRRQARGSSYQMVNGDEEEPDLELGEGLGRSEGQESGTIASIEPTLEEEVDNWDENGDDWDDDTTGVEGGGEGQKTPSSSAEDGADALGKKRDD